MVDHDAATSATILIVDDEPAILDLCAAVLEPAGFAILKAEGSSEALKICAQHTGPIHLLLTDLVLPPPDLPIGFGLESVSACPWTRAGGADCNDTEGFACGVDVRKPRPRTGQSRHQTGHAALPEETFLLGRITDVRQRSPGESGPCDGSIEGGNISGRCRLVWLTAQPGRARQDPLQRMFGHEPSGDGRARWWPAVRSTRHTR